MIPEYKLWHGAVLADLVDSFNGPVTFREHSDPGRLLNYVVNNCIGMQIRFATKKLHPWNFTFSAAHVGALVDLQARYPVTFLVLVCRDDGIIAVEADQVIPVLATNDQTWLRADRRKREMYRLYGPAGEFSGRFRTTVDPIVEALHRLGSTS